MAINNYILDYAIRSFTPFMAGYIVSESLKRAGASESVKLGVTFLITPKITAYILDKTVQKKEKAKLQAEEIIPTILKTLSARLSANIIASKVASTYEWNSLQKMLAEYTIYQSMTGLQTVSAYACKKGEEAFQELFSDTSEHKDHTSTLNAAEKIIPTILKTLSASLSANIIASKVTSTYEWNSLQKMLAGYTIYQSMTGLQTVSAYAYKKGEEAFQEFLPDTQEHNEDIHTLLTGEQGTAEDHTS